MPGRCTISMSVGPFVPGGSELGRVDWTEADLIAGREHAWRLARRVERDERGAADDVPAAGCHIRVDTGLASRDRYRTGRHRQPRRGSTRRGDPRIHRAEIRE